MKLRLMIQSVLGSSRKVSTVGSRLFTNTTAKRHASSNGENKKPDLKRAGKDTRASKVIGAACLLVAIYMYPMIFKPLLGIGQTDGELCFLLSNLIITR